MFEIIESCRHAFNPVWGDDIETRVITRVDREETAKELVEELNDRCQSRYIFYEYRTVEPRIPIFTEH